MWPLSGQQPVVREVQKLTTTGLKDFANGIKDFEMEEGTLDYPGETL